MRLTRIHLAYWQARRVPQWAADLQWSTADTPPDVHACINASAGLPPCPPEPSAMLSLLWHAREHAHLWNLTPANSLRASLQRMASGSTTHRPGAIRAHYAAKWLARIERERLARALRDVPPVSYAADALTPWSADALKNSGPTNFSATTLHIGRRDSYLPPNLIGRSFFWVNPER